MSASSFSASSSAGPLPSKGALRVAELRNQILIGDLPNDFLRISQPQTSQQSFQQQQQKQQQQIDSAFQQQQQIEPGAQYSEPVYAFVPPHTRGRISIKIVEAKLTKNYGLVRMDPYVRVRVGNTIFETPTSVNGGKTPSWDRIVNAYLPNEVESIYLQIFDERAFTNDECVAWAHIILPEGIFDNELIDEWYSLSGPQGDGKEGVINLIISFTPINAPPPTHPTRENFERQQRELLEQEQRQIAESIGLATNTTTNTNTTTSIINEPSEPLFTDDELNELHEMFPTIEKEVVRTVLEAQSGDKNATVTALLEIAN